MQIITGKQWKQKTEYYIQESLKKETGTWIVPAKYKYEYEKMLLNASLKGAILNHRVVTFDELFEEKLKQLYLFDYRKISTVEMMLIIYELLSKQTLSICKKINMGVIKELMKVFKEFNQYNVEGYDKLDLPQFSKQKLKECFALYQQFLEILNDRHLYLDIDPRLIQEADFTDEVFFVDQFDTFTDSEIMLLKQMKDVTVLMTCDDSDDLYTNVVKKYFSLLGGKIVSFDQECSLLQSYLINNFQNLKAVSYLEKHQYTFFNAVNPSIEIEAVARDIFYLIMSGEYEYKDFALYCVDASYNNEIKRVFNLHQLPYTPASSDSLNHISVVLLVKNLINYLKESNLEYVALMCQSGLLRQCFSTSQIDYITKAIQTSMQCELLEDIILELETMKKALLSKQYCDEYTTIIKKYLADLEIGYDENYSKLIEKIGEFDVHQLMPLEDYLMLLNEVITLKETIEKPFINEIALYNDWTLTDAKKVYILGCSEGMFPTICKDQGLILNDERLALGKMQLVSPNLFEQIELEYLSIFKLLICNNQVSFSYASGTIDGKTLLPSSLYLALLSMFKQKEERYNYNNLKPTNLEASRTLFLDMPIDQKNEELIKLRKHYNVTKNQPSTLDHELYTQLLTKNFISPSELETYNGCPFKYFIQYGLGIYKWRDMTLKPNDFGTLVHDILDILTDLYTGNKTIEMYLEEYHIENVETYYQSNILNKICNDSTLEIEYQSIFAIIHHIANERFDTSLMNTTQLYFFNKLQHDLFNTIEVLLCQALTSQYVITGHEKGVKKMHQDLLVYGRFDRQENYGQYVKVVDYKSSAKKLDLHLATLGFNIQMLLYLDMIVDEKLNKAGVLYFNTKQRILKSDDYIMNTAVKEEDLLKEYKMEGYVLDERSAIEALGEDPSMIANVKYVKSKDSYSGNILNKEQFDSLIEKVNERVDTIISEIYQQGNISIMPSHSNNPAAQMIVNPCTYCDYQSVCLKDVFYNENREIEYIDKKTMMKILGGESDD